MKRRILLIEDDQADAMAFRRELQKQDSSVDLVVAREASEAMQLLTEGNIAQVGVSSFLVVVDQQLPGISGLDWIAGLRANSLLCGTPVVMLTGDSEGIPDRRARRLGLNLVLEKEDLHDAVEKILERLSRRTQDHAKLGEERSELRALLVDDDSVDRMQLRRVIERMRKEDWSLHEAERGEEALAYVQDLQPDLVFLDYALPDLDGVRILRELRVRMAMRLPRVVAVTGAGSEEVARRLFLLGVEDYLVKRSISSGSIYRLLDLASREIRSPRVREPRLEGARTPLVALSGSTGGMKVCRDVLAAMPANVPFAMLLILHLNRGEGQERLLDVLGRETELELRWVEDGEVPLPGRAYVARPGYDTGLVHGEFHCSAVGNFPEPVPSIDVALRTAAESQGSEIISIHLSGMGADGVAGASQVRNRAGDVWVQDPSEAEFPAIPIAIQQAGLADRVIRSEQIASAILQLWSR